MSRFSLMALLVVAATISGCNRRDRVDAPPTPQRPVQRQGVDSPLVTPHTTPAALPEESIPLALPTVTDAVAGPTAEAAVVPLDPLWDELDDALEELDSALAGIEAWEVDVP